MNALRTGCGRWIGTLASRGWTYQLVKRNMWVYSVDNGPMAQSLMDTGQVTWLREDGFKFRPTQQYLPGWYAIWLKNRRKLRH